MSSENNSNTANTAMEEDKRDNLKQDEPTHNQTENDTQNNSNTDDSKNDGVPTKGTAGVMQSNFGADNTTTSTFEKSQGEKYGEKFDETGEQIKGKFSVSEPSGKASSSGSGDSKAAGSDASSAPQNKRDEENAPKEGFAQKLKNKAEGMFHGHHENKAESRAEAH